MGLALTTSAVALELPKPPEGVKVNRKNAKAYVAYTKAMAEYWGVVSECNTKTLGVVESFRDIKATWMAEQEGKGVVTDPKSNNTNLLTNLKAVEQRQKEVGEKLKAFAAEFSKVEGDRPALQKALQNLEGKTRTTVDEISKAVLAESYFMGVVQYALWFLNEFEKDPNTVEAIAFARSDNCNTSEVAPLVNRLVNEMYLLRDFLEGMKATGAEFRKRRQLLVNYVYTKTRNNLEAAWNQDIAGELKDTQDTLTQTLMFGRLQEQVTKWRYGLRTAIAGTDTFYLQYENPIRLYRAYRQQGSNFLSRAGTFPKVPEWAVKSLTQDINTVFKHIDSRIKRIEDMGWEKLLGYQISSANRKKAYLDRLADSCEPTIDTYLEFAANVVDLKNFRKAEVLFAEVVDNCKYKRN